MTDLADLSAATTRTLAHIATVKDDELREVMLGHMLSGLWKTLRAGEDFPDPAALVAHLDEIGADGAELMRRIASFGSPLAH